MERRGLLTRGRSSGMMLDVFLRHYVFAAMLVRATLRCFSSCYRFIQSHYAEDVALWPTVAEEICIQGHPTLRTSWLTPWSGYVTLSDASEYGWGLVTGHLDPELVARHGRIKERSRWRHADKVAPRETALAALGRVNPGNDVDSPCAADQMNVEFPTLIGHTGQPIGDIDTSFPELDSAILYKSKYKVSKFDRWTEEEDIHVRESHALLYGM